MEHLLKEQAKFLPLHQWIEPDELSGTLLFLCDDTYSGFITGVNIPVDGGFNAYSGV